MSNPLLTQHKFPPFKAIEPEHVAVGVEEITKSNLAALDKQLEGLSTVTWESLIVPIEARDDILEQAWSPVSHLNGVANNDALREAYEKSLGFLTEYSTAVGQNKALYDAYQALSESQEFSTLSQPKKQTIENALRNFKLAGVALPENEKERFKEIKSKLSELTNKFSNNVLDATRGWFIHVTDESRLAGLPDFAIAGAKKAAEQKSLDGHVLTLDGPVYLTVMTQAEDVSLREEMYTGFCTRASDQGPTAGQWNNNPLLEEILALRAELAQLLGFNNYAELSLAPKMAESTEQVLNFLTELADKSKAIAQQEVAELNAWVKETYGIDQIDVWDMTYYSEKLKEAKYEISQETLRPYFPLPKIQAGLFDVAHKLFGIDITPAQNEDLYHEDVQFFEISRGGEAIAYFYLDVYAREGKRGGAWMADARVRRQTADGMQLPIAFLTCNFTAPVGETPCLLTHNEVTTLFHEFGHGLHHMLTKIDVAAVSGISGVAWDAVELPSQFLENWCWQREVLKSFSGHYETGEPLPDTLIDKLLNAKNFHSALMMLRQIEFALFDFRIHLSTDTLSFKDVQAVLNTVRDEVSVVQPPAFNRFQNGFTHIFAGGYAAGYYSYKWAEVLSSDAFEAFEETHYFDKETGQRFLSEILEKGGSESAMALFKSFRGREPSIKALLRHSGIQ